MIPKKIHYCWFGRGVKSKLAQRCLASWKKYMPDYEIIEWNEDNFDVNTNAYTKMCYDDKKYAFLTDYLRLVIIEKQGGLYFDTDVEVVKPFDDLLGYGAFFGFETERFVNTGEGFGAEPHHPIVRRMLEAYEPFLDGKHGTKGCPLLNTDALLMFGLQQDGKKQQLGNAVVLPSEYLNPYDDPTGILTQTANTYSIHWYGKSWMSKGTVLRSKLTKSLHRLQKRLRSTLLVPKIDVSLKKILIFSHAMELGGAERALLGLLENIDTTKYQVDLFLMRHEGELMKYIPNNIHLLPEIPQYACLAVPFAKVLKHGHLGMAVGRFAGKQKAARRVKLLNLPTDNDVALQYSHKYTLPFVPNVSEEEYDLAISFLTPHYFVAEKVKAKKKIAWIHTDYGVVSVDREEQLKMWSRYDWIASISDDVTKSFCMRFPELTEKVKLMPNIMPIKSIQEQAYEFDAEADMPNDGTIRLLSVGRFCVAKNFDNVPDICRRIREKGLNVKWFLIGYGSDEALIKEKIAEAEMQDFVIILGKKNNPYPYIKACDFYVQPSRYEGKCVAVREAQILHKPVVITNYATASSQLDDGVDGIVVSMDNEQCAAEVADFILDTSKVANIIEETERRDYTDKRTINIINQFLGVENGK